MTNTLTYIEHPGTIELPGWSIPFALTLPADWNPQRELPSAILLVPGSLFSDVNGDYPAWNSFPHVYAHLARKLSALGHAVFRYAKIGPGTGSVTTTHEAPIPRTWDGRHQMTAGAFAAMRDELARREVKVARVIGAGHSEGAVAVSVLATSAAGADLDGVVLLSGPSVGILEIMREQVGFGRAPEDVDAARAQLDEVIAIMRRGEPVPAKYAEGGGLGASALASMPPEAQQYMRDVDATNPTMLAREITQPLLIVQGGNDTSVPAHHGERLRDAAGDRAEYLFVAEVTHMYKVVPAHLSPPEVFGYPGETDHRVTDGIDRWIRRIPS